MMRNDKSKSAPSKEKEGRNKRWEVTPKSGFLIPSEIGWVRRQITYLNLDEEVLVILLDKLKISLLDYVDRPRSRGKDLVASVTSTVALLLMFVTAEFRPRFGLPGSSWYIICVVLLVGSFLWSVVCIFSALRAFRKRKTVDEFIGELKKQCRVTVERQEPNYFEREVEDHNSEAESPKDPGRPS